MNISGPPIAQLLPSKSRAGPLTNLVIISDSLQHKPCKFHTRLGGSASGHNGLKSLITSLGGNNQFWQVRVGIGSNRAGGGEVDSADYVMERLSSHEVAYWGPRGPGIELMLKELEKIALKQSPFPPKPVKPTGTR